MYVRHSHVERSGVDPKVETTHDINGHVLT